MASETHLEFTYERKDIVSAQQLRLLNGPMLKILLAIWIGAVLVVGINVFFPETIHFIGDASWISILQISAVFLGTLILVYFIAPWLDFRWSQVAKKPFYLQITNDKLVVKLISKDSGAEMKWNQIVRVLENKRIYILSHKSEQDFVIIPRSAFKQPAQERRFREILSRRAKISEKVAARLKESSSS